MRTLLIILLAGALVGCQSGNEDRDISGSITDPKLRAQLAEEFQQRKAAMGAMETHCARQWDGEPSMIAYCQEKQTPVLRRYVSDEVMFKHMNKTGLFEKDYQAHLACRMAHYGDFEMAQACVDNERAVRRYTAIYKPG